MGPRPQWRIRQSDGLLRLRLRRRGVNQLQRHGDFVWQDGQDLHLPSARRPHERPERNLLLRTRERPQVAPVRLGTGAFGRGEPEGLRQVSTTMAPMLSARTSGKPCGGTRRASASSRRATKDYPIPHPGELGTAVRSGPCRRRSSRTTAMPWSPLSWTGRSTARCRSDNVAYNNPTYGREDHPLPGDPYQKGLHGLQARVERPEHDLHE